MAACSQSTQYEFQLGESAVIPISVKDVNGNPVNADATPTVSWMTLNGVGVDPTTVAYNVQIAQTQDDTPAAVTGEYQLTYDTSAFTGGDVLEFGVTAAVNSVTLNTRKSSKVVDRPDQRPSIC